MFVAVAKATDMRSPKLIGTLAFKLTDLLRDKLVQKQVLFSELNFFRHTAQNVKSSKRIW